MSLFDQLVSASGTFPSLSVKSITDDSWGVEGIYSQQFSVGIFFFLIICIIVFMMIVVKYMQSGSTIDSDGVKKSGLKRGEKVMFVFIIMGVVVAVIMAVMQLLQGYLF